MTKTHYRRATLDRKPRPAKQILRCRAGSAQALLVDLLFVGVTIQKATKAINRLREKHKGRSRPLSEASLRAMISYDITTIKGYGVKAKTIDITVPMIEHLGKRYKTIYQLVLPKGMTEPLPHTLPKEKLK